jgi:hypothetical protein
MGSRPEERVRDSFPLGRVVDLSTGDEGVDNPAEGLTWGPGRSVRAEVIAGALLGGRPEDQVRAPSVRLRGARVTGRLDLSWADVPYAMVLQDCFFDEPPALHGASARLADFSGSVMAGLQISEIKTDALVLDRCHFSGPVDATGASVSGTFSLRAAELQGDPALLGGSLAVGRDMICANMTVRGEILLWGARVGGALVFDGAILKNPDRNALTADGLIAERGLFGQNGFSVSGKVQLQDARIGRRLALPGATLNNPAGIALSAERLSVDGDLLLNEGFTALGNMDISGGQVRGSMSLSTAHLVNPGDIVLLADRLHVTGQLSCDRGFVAEGEIRFNDAHIGDGPYFEGSQIVNAGGAAITAWGMVSDSVVNCCEGFTCDGLINFTNARIMGELCFEGANIEANIDLRHLQAAVLRTDAQTDITGTMDLRHAAIGVLRDDQAGWPNAVRLDGLTFTALTSPLPASERLRWLELDTGGYHPQPYEQLASAYRAMGNDDEARTVMLERQRSRRRTLTPPLRAWGYLQDWMVGYGYRPGRAALWLVALLVAGTAAFAIHPPAPLNDAQSPVFSPFLYALDLLIPLVGFGQRDAFNPRGWEQWLAAGLIAAGWILASTIAAGISRVLSRQ